MENTSELVERLARRARPVGLSHPVADQPVRRALVERLRTRVSAPLTRFAPAPTGYLHLGHIANAIYVWGLAAALGGRVLLRIEDHDRQRCRPEFERALLDDLDWLGFSAQLYPTAEFRRGTCAGRQSDRALVYEQALAPLIESGRVYACDCTRRQLDDGPYPGRCRDRGLPLRDDLGWRVRLEPGEERFDDGLLGPQRQAPVEQCGDVLVRDRLGNWTYQWAATVDDTVQGIALIVRGRDLLDSTGRQIQLARLIGRAVPPVFAHHPLIMKSPAQKLSKSDGDTGIRDLRAAGWTASRVIGHAACAVGLQKADRSIAASDTMTLFGEDPA
jgi:glutamyl-tRNA synthetase/glutamyl-Q tRNA(Asp) synthetase